MQECAKIQNIWKFMNKFLERSRVLFLDTGAVIKLLKMDSDYYPVISSVLDYMYDVHATIIVSQITLFEISKRACLKNERVLARQYREFFERSRGVIAHNVDGEIAIKAAEFVNELSTEESLRLATAYVAGADCILTDCAKFKDLIDVPVVTLDETM